MYTFPPVLPVRERGFSLIELLVAISIIALLVAILLPSLKGAKERAEQLQCTNNIRQGAQAYHQYIADNKESFIGMTTWGYMHGQWYQSLRQYVTLKTPQPPAAQTFRNENPEQLLCTSRVTGVYTYGFPRYMYGTNWYLMFRNYSATNWGPPLKLFELRDQDKTGLLFDTVFYDAAIHAQQVQPTYVGVTITNLYDYSTPLHYGKGMSIAYMDGHATFAPGDPITSQYVNPPESYPWTHRTFWGRFVTGDYRHTYYWYTP